MQDFMMLFRSEENPTERLVAQGWLFLERATAGGETGRYQLEAAIAFLHTAPQPGPEKWPTILTL